MRFSFHNLIKTRIKEADDDSVFTINDFTDIADDKTVSKTLTRLEKSGHIKKLLRGIYCKLGKKDNEPRPYSIAKAIARCNFWKLAPCGETALYIAGLKTSAPKKWTFVTDGTYRNYTVSGTTIEFRRTTGNALSQISNTTMLLIQVIKAYGKENINGETAEKIRGCFKFPDYKTLKEETKQAADWIKETVMNIFPIKQK